jgi:hypothetical protein
LSTTIGDVVRSAVTVAGLAACWHPHSAAAMRATPHTLCDSGSGRLTRQTPRGL